MFPSRSPVHISSGASTSSLPLPNPYGPNLSGSYVSLSGGYMSMSPPPSAPPTGPLPPAPKPSEKQAIKQTLELEDGEDELGEGNSTLLSTLDAFRRRLREEDEGESVESQSEEEGIRTSSGGWLGRLSSGDFNEAVVIKPEEGAKEVMCSAGERRPSDAGVGGEDGHSDGEVGIGLSLMSALDGDGDDDDDEAVPSASAHVASTSATIDGSNCASAPLTQYAPEAPSEPCSVKDQSENGQVQSSTSAQDKVDTEGIDGSHPEPEDEEDECEMAEDDEGGYWDDIYDDYRYSRYSLASKRFSVASRRMSVVSKGSAGSKTSGTSKSSRAPPMPVPPFSPDHPGFSAERPRASADRRSFERPSFGSDRPSQASERDGRPSLYSRPSFESASTTASAESSVLQSPSHPFTQSFDLSLSDDARSSSYSTQTLDRLSSQFPAVPTGVPVRVESRLRIVNDGHVELEEDMHREKEMEVAHESTGDETSPAMKEESEVKKSLVADDKNRYQVDKPTANSMVSPLLHTTFGSPHSSRVYTDTEGSEHGHRSWSLYRSKSPRSSRHDEDNDLPAGALKSPFESQGAPVEDGGLGSVLNKAGGEGSCALPSATLSENVSGAEIGMKVNVVNDNDADLASTGGDDSFVTSSADTSQTATAPPSTSSTPKPDEQQSSHHLRPPNRVHPFSRTSIFLPHPNAPKSAGHQGLGPMYARPIQAQHYSATPGGPGSVLSPSLPPNSSAFAAPVLHHLRSAFLVHSPGSGMPARRPPMTIFARCQPELSESIGPVPIVFSLEPLPPLTPSPTGPPRYGQNSASPLSPTRSATLPPPAPKSPIAANVSEPSGAGVSIGNAGETSANVSSPTEMQLRLPKRSATTSVFPSEPARDTIRPAVMTAAAVTAPTLPIPRAGFVPQVGGDVRPRSRSFSEFGAKVTEPVLPEKSREEPGPGPRLRQYSALPRSFTSRPIPPPLNLPSNTVNQDVLALSSSNATHSPHSASFKPIASPISPSPTAPARQAIPHPLASSGSVPVSTASTSPAFVPSPTQEKDSQAPTGRTSALSSYPRNVTSPRSWIQTHGGSLDVPQQDSVDSCPPCQSSDSDDPAPVVQSLPIPDNIRGTQQSPIAHEIPLRNKLSLPVLRGKTTTRQRLDDAISITSSHGGLGGSTENETVQVQDMDFELVKPSIPHITGRTSQDSTLASHDPHIDPVSPSPLGDTASIHSSAPRSPLVVNEQTSDNALDAQAAADAHRQREVRWMALLPTVPPSQARKNKKVRRLLQDGVPSSLRYLIWCHLTDSKARAIPGVYAKLSKRPRVPAFAEIERDTTKCFPDQPQLHSAQGPVVSVLQAYLSMVPDIQYSSALTSIAGHLLQLAPEEDAFWIFASMMDAHLRPYFSSSTIQMEVDAALFSKAIETNDSVLSKKLYVTLQIGPVDVIRPWFSNLFVGTLPIDHLHRIWDMFLYEGVTLLFRIGLAIVHCVRHLLLQATSEEIALAHLIHPPVACLPSSPEDLLTLSFNMKLKDDVRKQRVKMEAQVKRQTQARALPANGISSRQTTSISLPRP
ncbi:hypothetical protein ID866_4565 [Astraeus odoratus]|nr:hypothetical protein ID866_4565 [Astraeus odoratus]